MTLPAGMWLSEGDSGRFCQRPRTILDSGASHADYLHLVGVRWSSWGGLRASGRATLVDCAQGCVRLPVTLVAFSRQGVARCGPGHAYTRLRITTRKGSVVKLMGGVNAGMCGE
jgi:hypothetical protein